MGLKGFLESAKFRHLFFFPPGLFPLPRSMTVKIISLSNWRKGGERGGLFRMGQVTVEKNNFGAAKRILTNALGFFFFQAYSLNMWSICHDVWVVCVRNDHMGVS